MKNIISILIAILLVNCSSIKKHNAHLNDLISPQELQSDVDYAYTKMKDLHPKLYWYISQKDLDFKFDSLKSTLIKPLTSFEFYKKLTPVICAVREGHMILLPDVKQYSNKENKAILKKGIGPLSQFDFEIFGDKMYVAKNKSYNNSIKIGTEVIAINGRKTSEFLNEYKNWFASDGFNKTFKNNRLSKIFSLFYSFENGLKDSLTYDFISNNNLKKITIARKIIDTAGTNKKKITTKAKITRADKVKIKAEKKRKDIFGYDVDKKIFNRNLHFLEKDSSIAVMKINSFTKGDSDAFYDESFSRIQKFKSKILILDLRNNTGGRLNEIAYLYSYLSDTTFVFMDDAQVTKKSSLFHAEYFKSGSVFSKIGKSILAPIYYPFQYFRVHKKRDRKYYYTSESKPKKVKKEAFRGKIYVLINGGSFSASSIISSNLKGSKRAYFVGEETGGAYNGTIAGQMPIQQLPNSKLKLKLGISACIPHYKTNTEGRGIFPDKEIIPTIEDRINNQDPEMKWILEDAKK